MPERLEDLVNVSSAADFEGASKVNPGDLNQFAPGGFGFGGILPIRPWDDLDKLPDAQKFYGFEYPQGSPIQQAPSTEAGGGVVYFGGAQDNEIKAMTRLMSVRSLETTYAVFYQRSDDTERDRYLDQIRIMTRYALTGVFRASGPAVEQIGVQPMSISDLIGAFIRWQTDEWNPDGRAFGGKLDGVMGGDGDFAREALAFGFMVENTYWGIYRLWSRAWLVTK